MSKETGDQELRSPEIAYEDMFPPVMPTVLRNFYAANHQEIDQIAQTYLGWTPAGPRLSQRYAVAISLFCTNKMDKSVDETVMTADQLEKWMVRYGEPLKRNLKLFPRLFDPSVWKIIAYLCPHSLEKLKPANDLVRELAQYPFVELKRMNHPTVGHSPGALWRLLSMSDYSLQEVLIFDIDEPWDNPVNRWHEETLRYDKALTRGVHIPREKFWLKLDRAWFDSDKQVNAYPPIMCSKLNVLPERLGLPDMDKLIATYVWLRMRQSRSSNPVSQIDIAEPVTDYNRALPDEPFGHQNHWYQYCFDERFLKHVVFPYAAERGEVCTYCLPQDVTTELAAYFSRPSLKEFSADFRYTQRVNGQNVIINQHAECTEVF